MNCPTRLPLDAEPIALRPVDKALFREGMARVGAAVHVVTTDGPAGLAGFTATAVCSVSDSPPSLLVCLNRNASVYGTVRDNGVLGVNALAPGHEEISALFGGKTPVAERFAAARWRIGETGAPLLEGAVVSFDCRIASAAEVGGHTVLFCEIVGVAGLERGDALVYFNRAYHRIGASL
jgi:flavin reductase